MHLVSSLFITLIYVVMNAFLPANIRIVKGLETPNIEYNQVYDNSNFIINCVIASGSSSSASKFGYRGFVPFGSKANQQWFGIVNAYNNSANSKLNGVYGLGNRSTDYIDYDGVDVLIAESSYITQYPGWRSSELYPTISYEDESIVGAESVYNMELSLNDSFIVDYYGIADNSEFDGIFGFNGTNLYDDLTFNVNCTYGIVVDVDGNLLYRGFSYSADNLTYFDFYDLPLFDVSWSDNVLSYNGWKAIFIDSFSITFNSYIDGDNYSYVEQYIDLGSTNDSNYYYSMFDSYSSIVKVGRGYLYYDYGYDIGYDVGYEEGLNESGSWDILGIANRFLDTEILPGFRLSYVIYLAIGMLVLPLIFRLIFH